MGIPIVYFRSSSFNCHRFCPQQFYMEYMLGWRGESNKKADKGTITHKALEICALAKKAAQDGKKTFVDDVVGEVESSNYDPEYLEGIIQKVYKYYTEQFSHHNNKEKSKWTDKDYRDCSKWTWKALEINDGMFDPRNRNVVEAEPHFDFVIEEDWAKYDYDLNGRKLQGYLGLKGTIDLVADLGDGVYEIIDWKTGRRLDWATGEIKDQNKLFSDAQLRLYHYAISRMYPDVKSFIFTIYFINDGGPFSVHFQESDMPKTKEMIMKKFQFIKNTEEPELIRTLDPKQKWKCTKLCHAGMSTFEGTNVLPILEHRPGKVTKHGQNMTKCEQVKYMIQKHGVEYTTEHCKVEGFDFASYKAPGSVE